MKQIKNTAEWAKVGLFSREFENPALTSASRAAFTRMRGIYLRGGRLYGLLRMRRPLKILIAYFDIPARHGETDFASDFGIGV